MPRTSFYDAVCHHGTTTYHQGASVHQELHREVLGGARVTLKLLCATGVSSDLDYMRLVVLFLSILHGGIRSLTWSKLKPGME